MFPKWFCGISGVRQSGACHLAPRLRDRGLVTSPGGAPIALPVQGAQVGAECAELLTRGRDLSTGSAQPALPARPADRTDPTPGSV